MSDRQELIRRFAVAIVQGEYANPESDMSMRAIWQNAVDLANAELPQPPADDRIERALQLLRDAQAYDWVESEVLSEVRRILEGKGNG